MADKTKVDDWEEISTSTDEQANDWKDITTPESNTVGILESLGAAARGIGQGLTASAGDEIAAGIGAEAADIIAKTIYDPRQPSKEDILKNISPAVREKIKAEDIIPAEIPENDVQRDYNTLVKAYRERLKSDEERAPYSTTAGNIAGFLASPASKLATLGRGANLGGRLVGTTVGGGALGGTTGFLSGEGGLEERLESAKTGTAIGAGTGLAGQALGEGLSALATSGPGKAAASAFRGEKLSELTGPLKSKLRDVGSRGTRKLKEMVATESKKVDDLVVQATQEGKTVKTGTMLDNIKELLEDLPDSVSKRRIQRVVDSADASDSPENAFNVIKAIKRNTAPGNDPAERAVFKEMDTVMKDTMKDAIDVKGPYKKMSNLLGKYEAITKKQPNKFLDERDVIATRNRTEKLLRELDPQIKGKTEYREIAEGIPEEGIPGLKEVAPEVADIFETQAPEIAEKIRIGEAITGTTPQGSASRSIVSQVLGLLGGGTGALYKLGEGAGSAARYATTIPRATARGVTKAREFVDSNIASLGRVGQNFDEASMTNLSTKMKRTGNGEYAEVLDRAIPKGEEARRAAMFSLMQTPGFRRAMVNSEDEEQQ